MQSSPVLCVHGVYYVVPYMREHKYSVRDGREGASVVDTLVFSFKKPQQPDEEARVYFADEVLQGRVFLERHKRSRDDSRPFCGGFSRVVDPEMLTERSDRLKLVRHVHERCALNRGPIEVLWTSANGLIQAVNKPAGLPVVDSDGGYLTVGELCGGWRCGHRLDVCVSGVLLLGKVRQCLHHACDLSHACFFFRVEVLREL